MTRTAKLVSCLVAIVSLSAAGGVARARLTRAWGYDDLLKGADLVVIARPGTTTDTGKQEELPGIRQVDKSGKESPVMGERLATDFTVVTVLKGKALDPKGKAHGTFVLHHDKDGAGGPAIDGPGFVTFDASAHKQYLMFLVRGKDGQYAAVSGLTDPWFSIEPLQNGY